MMNKKLSVGIWIELSALALSESKGEGIIKWIRHLVAGLESVPEVLKIVVPAERECVPLLRDLMRGHDGAAPKKLDFALISTGKSRRDRVTCGAEQRLTDAQQKLMGLGGSPNPLSWPSACIAQAERRRKLSRKVGVVAETLFKLTKSTYSIVDARARMYVTSKQEQFETLVTAKRRMNVDFWIVPSPAWRGISSFTEKKVFVIPDLVYREFDLTEIGSEELSKAHNAAVEAINQAHAVACFSEHVARTHIAPLMPIESRAPRVIPHAPTTSGTHETVSKVMSKNEVADRIRTYFRTVFIDRFYCDFPFEQCDYLFVSGKCRPYKNYGRLLDAYELILRKQRRNLKLIVTGSLRGNQKLREQLVSRGLVCDVVECPNVDESVHEGLVAHSKCLIIPTLFEGGFPFGYCEAAQLGVPTAMSKISVTREQLGSDLDSPEYFDPNSTDDIVRGVSYALDNDLEVVSRQRRIASEMSTRTWSDVAREFISCACTSV